MKGSEITGRWQLSEVEYPPIEEGEDDGGFADALTAANFEAT